MPDRLREILGQDTPVRVVIVEHGPCVAGDMGDEPRPYIEARLRELGIETIVGSGVSGLDEGGVALDDGARIQTDTVILSAVIRAVPLTAQLHGEHDTPGLQPVKPDFRAHVTPHLFPSPTNTEHTT